MQINVKLFANLRDFYPEDFNNDSYEIEVSSGTIIKDLYQKLEIPEEEVKIVFVNNKKRNDDYELQDGDKVAIFPPIAGG